MTSISSSHQMTVTHQLAQHISDAAPHLSSDAMIAARHGVLDFLAAAFAGASDCGLKKLQKIIEPSKGLQASIIGISESTDVLNAALLNGYAGHALDYDDVHGNARGHPSTVLLPALFALAEARGSSALDLLEAYIV